MNYHGAADLAEAIWDLEYAINYRGSDYEYVLWLNSEIAKLSPMTGETKRRQLRMILGIVGLLPDKILPRKSRHTLLHYFGVEFDESESIAGFNEIVRAAVIVGNKKLALQAAHLADRELSGEEIRELEEEAA